MKPLLLIFLFGLTVFPSACSWDRPAEGTSRQTQDKPVVITAENFKTICGMQWILKEMTVDGNPVPLTGETPFLKIEPDGKISGFASVNRFFGALKIDGKGTLEHSPIGSTRMAGPFELMEQERLFLLALKKIEQISGQGIYLYAYTIDRKTELIFYVPVT